MTLLSPVLLLALGAFLGFLGLALGGRASQALVIVAAVLTGISLLFMVVAGHA
jgi:hypothetical protein